MKKIYFFIVIVCFIFTNVCAIYHLPKEVTIQNSFDVFGRKLTIQLSQPEIIIKNDYSLR